MKEYRPAWWQINVLVPFVIALTVLEQMRPLPGISVAVVDTGIIVFAFGAILLWVRSNSGALADSPMQREENHAYKVSLIKAQPYPSIDSVEHSSDPAQASELPYMLIPAYPVEQVDEKLRLN